MSLFARATLRRLVLAASCCRALLGGWVVVSVELTAFEIEPDDDLSDELSTREPLSAVSDPRHSERLDLARVYLHAGREARAAGDLAAAVRSLRAAVIQVETLAFAWAELGQVLLVTGKDAAAAISYERALELGRAHQIADRWSSAKRIYLAIGSQPPELPEPERPLTEKPRRLSVADPPRARALCNLGEGLLQAERRPAAAKVCFERARELDPECGHAWIGLADIECEDFPERAELLFRRARELISKYRAKLDFELPRLQAELGSRS